MYGVHLLVRVLHVLHVCTTHLVERRSEAAAEVREDPQRPGAWAERERVAAHTRALARSVGLQWLLRFGLSQCVIETPFFVSRLRG